MAVYNLQALADRTKYLMTTQGMTQAEAEEKVFSEAGLTGTNALAPNVLEAYHALLANPTTDSKFARNDREALLDRRRAGAEATYALNTNEQTADQDTATPEATPEPPPTEF